MKNPNEKPEALPFFLCAGCGEQLTQSGLCGSCREELEKNQPAWDDEMCAKTFQDGRG